MFLIYEEFLSSLLRQTERRGSTLGVRVARRAPRISHILFSNDSLIFWETSNLGATNLMEVLRGYENSSVQLINFEKSSVFFSANVGTKDLSVMKGILGVLVVDNLERYLGLPCVVGRNKKRTFASLKDKLSNRILS